MNTRKSLIEERSFFLKTYLKAHRPIPTLKAGNRQVNSRLDCCVISFFVNLLPEAIEHKKPGKITNVDYLFSLADLPKKANF